jgi:hypothetical protein
LPDNPSEVLVEKMTVEEIERFLRLEPEERVAECLAAWTQGTF